MSSGEYLLICRSVQRLSVKSAVEIFCFEHIDDHMIIHLLDQLLHTVISSYEINDIVQLIQDVDEHVIINVFKTENFYGGFYRESLD